MSELPCGFAVTSRNHSLRILDNSSPTCLKAQSYSIISLPYGDPARQEKRLPIRILKMLTAHTSHILHPEYLQPLSSAPVSIEVGNSFLNKSLTRFLMMLNEYSEKHCVTVRCVRLGFSFDRNVIFYRRVSVCICNIAIL